MSWIRFGPPGQVGGQKTLRWPVRSADGSHYLGEVRWFAPWRKYAFYPGLATVFEEDCLHELANFCEARTREHKRRKEKP